MRNRIRRAVMMGLLIVAGVGDSACLPAEIACPHDFCDSGSVCSEVYSPSTDLEQFACIPRSFCGNSMKDLDEQCDDGNSIDGDGCDSNCMYTRCGNGVVTAGEQCDDGNSIDGDGCDSNCTPTGCGNGIVTAGEQCDDGNCIDGDGCNHNCMFP